MSGLIIVDDLLFLHVHDLYAYDSPTYHYDPMRIYGPSLAR